MKPSVWADRNVWAAILLRKLSKHFKQVTLKMAKDQNLAVIYPKYPALAADCFAASISRKILCRGSQRLPLVGTCVKMNGTRMIVLRNDVINKKVTLTNENQELTEISLEQFEGLELVSKPAIEQC